MSTLLAILAVIAFLVAILGLFAPNMVLGWLPPVQRSKGKAFGIYFILALLLGGGAQLAMTPAEQAEQDQVLAEATADAEAAMSAAGEAGEQAVNATRATGAAVGDSVGNASGDARQDDRDTDDRDTMEQAQEWVTRAANATRQGAKDAWEGAKDIGSELVEGSQELWEDAKGAGEELINSEPAQ